MSDLLFTQRMTKGAFEQRLVESIGAEGITACPYTEEAYGDGAPVKMTLYYKNGVHAGTWQGGKGWAFRRNYS